MMSIDVAALASQVQLLIDRQDIVDVLTRYATAVDARDYEMLVDVFTDDLVYSRARPASAISTAGDYPTDADEVNAERGRDRRIERIRWFQRELGPTQHLLGNFRVAVDGDEASTVCAMRAFHVGTGDNAAVTYEVMGEYHDRLRRTADGWRICERTAVYELETGSTAVYGDLGA